MRWFPDEASYWAEKLETDINLSLIKSQEAPNLLKGNKLPPVWIKSIKPEHVAPQRNDTTAMIGDSIIKGLRNDLLSHAAKRRVTVRSFPTASSSDMKHYLQPSLQLEPS